MKENRDVDQQKTLHDSAVLWCTCGLEVLVPLEYLQVGVTGEQFCSLDYRMKERNEALGYEQEKE